MREHYSAELPTVSAHTTHLLSQALIRRGLAMEIGMVMTFERHEKIRQTLINALCEDPPPGYAAASMAQLERADMHMFAKFGEYTRVGLRGSIGSGLPLDQFVEKILDSPKFIMLLMPLARPSGSSGAASSSQGGEAPAKRPKADRQTATIDNLRRQVSNLKRKDLDSGGGAKKQKTAQQGGKGQRKSGPMPPELKGHLSSVQKGPICFAYNTPAGCRDAAPGQRCRRGYHLCCHRDCTDRDGHGFAACPRHR